MKLFVSAQTRFMTRKARAVSMLEYVLLAGVVITLVLILNNALNGPISNLLDRIAGFLNGQGN